MKIIGKTEDGFLAEVSENEIANLQGKSCTYSSGYVAPKSGMVISLTAIHEKWAKLQAAQGNLKHISKNLVELAEDLRPLETVLSATYEQGGE